MRLPRALSAPLALAVLLAGVACVTTSITGSGHVVASSVPASFFSRLEVGSAFRVTLTVGGDEQVTVRVDDNLTDHLDVGISDGTLRIRLKPGTSVRNATLEADVTAPGVSSIEVSGAAKLHLSDELAGQRIKMTLSGAGEIDGPVRFDEAGADLSGASHLELSGTAGKLDIRGSGASRLEAEQLQVGQLTIDLSGASQATVSVSGTISAQVSGASSVRYAGTPQFIRKDVSGGSSIAPL